MQPARRRLAVSGFLRFLVLAAAATANRSIEAQAIGDPSAQVAAAPAASNTTARVVRAKRATILPVVDGRLDDAAWREAPIVSDFVQRTPVAGARATLETEVRVLLDASAMYVAMRMHDSAPDSIVAPLARKDYQGYSDWAHVLIDSYHDRRSAFRFAVNPSGVKVDSYLSGDAERLQDYGWDAVWQGAAARDGEGWTAEFRIPLSQLRFAESADSAGSEWGIEFIRDVARRGERSLWAPIDPAARGFVSLFGTLSGVQLGDASRRAELTTYALVRQTSSPATRTAGGTDETIVFGADFKVGVTPNLTFTGSILPDFGQVEADPSQVNLTGAETFFAERRPFFTEGSDLFLYDLSAGPPIFGSQQLFYSRRIGRRPQLRVPGTALGTESQQDTRLLSASKLSGQFGAWSLGALSAVTERAEGRFLRSDGSQAQQIIEPAAHYGVLRFGRRFNGGTGALGIIATATNRRLGDSASASMLASSAYTGGIEGRWRFRDHYQLIGHAFGSLLNGTPRAVTRLQTSHLHLYQRPDLDGLGVDSSATALTGNAASMRLEKMTGGKIRFALSGQVVTSGFDINDLGFLTTSDYANGLAWIGREQFERTRYLRLWRSFADVWVTRGLHSPGSFNAVDWWNRFQFHNYWEIIGSVRRDFGIASTSVLRGGPTLRMPNLTTFEYRILTDPRRRVSWELSLGGAPPGSDGSHRATIGPGVIVRPSGRAEVQFQATTSWQRSGSQYVASPSNASGVHYLIGDLRQRTSSITGRFNFAFTRSLTLQGYAQPFVSGGKYVKIGEVVKPLASRFEDRVRFFDAGDRTTNAAGTQLTLAAADGPLSLRNPDFSIANLNANAILRWEYQPGSALFVAWNQGRSATGLDGRRSARELSQDLWSAPGTSVVLVKWSHYLGR